MTARMFVIGLLLLASSSAGAQARVVREGGKYVGAWGEVEQTFALTAEKAK